MLLHPDQSALRMIDVAKAAGVTRQTVDAHFSNRTDMLIAAVRHFGDTLDVDARLAASREADTGKLRIEAFTVAMLEFFPVIYPIQQALMRMGPVDSEAKAAWENRTHAMKEGCAAAIGALDEDGDLASGMRQAQATDYYFALLNMDNWANCVLQGAWSAEGYLQQLQKTVFAALVRI
ncbi:TetR/AcrR family transcriptional regulator [Epibacterium ulvae]|uniref:TetR/AcrR family transcriptional regulator n=1 Tax=Epibacterium ulvae TaxID=1156985 RepID=UPI001BFCC2A1|nr:TetR/AcrR family transcriptional regulator [Epibacterium ulvae]